MLPVDGSRQENSKEDRSRKPFFTATDYVFYLKRQDRTKATCTEDDSETELTEVEGMLVEIPKFTELLRKLRDDLRSYPSSFVDEFTSDRNDGIGCLLDLLKACQHKQSSKESSGSFFSRHHQRALKKAMSNEYDCLLCLKHASVNPKAVSKLTDYGNGMSTIAVCIMSSSSKSRLVALELLTKVCNASPQGHSKVLEAMSSLRVIFGESVRFKFLISMLNGNGAVPAGFERVTVAFLNSLLRSCIRMADKIRLQCEIEEAGLDIDFLEKKLREKNVPCDDEVWEEISKWRDAYVDMESVSDKKRRLETENFKLHHEVELLRKALKKLEEDKISLMHIEIELKDRCAELRDEVSTLKNQLDVSKKPCKTERSSTTSDSGKFSYLADDDFLAEDNGQAESEEILIDIPTIRPPVGFRSSTEDCISEIEKTKSKERVSRASSPTRPKTVEREKDADSALSESDSDGGLNWQYPDIPAANVSRSRSMERVEAPIHIPRSALGRVPRSLSADMKGFTRISNDLDIKISDSTTGFFFKARGDVSYRSDPIARYSSIPPADESGKIALPPPPPPPPTKSFPLPVSYRSNFVFRGHGACDLYSGISRTEEAVAIPPPDYKSPSPNGTISALVHKEITKAVQQLSGWL